ncbi:hypothetical protein [Arthrobacter sp. MA-N2]|uniref:hypothetical protein n=1 Tax=Arthrobacter sp. MA-N2 TaxID=1101188 RepID=UPI0004B6E21D|nr:hypothetical protein [Arthrobacter sp. MA-N2]
MTDYPYDMDLVVDPLNPANVVANGAVYIYDSADTSGTTLLALKDPSGLPLPNPLHSNAHGFLPPRIATSPQTLWKSGGFVGYFNSYLGLRNEAMAAKAAAQTAQASAESAASTAASTAADAATAQLTAAVSSASAASASAATARAAALAAQAAAEAAAATSVGGGVAVNPTDTDSFIISTKSDGSVIVAPSDPDAYLITL